MTAQSLTTRFSIGPASNYVPGTTTGLVPSTGLPGKTDGVAVVAGNIGQVISTGQQTYQASNTGIVASTTITLTPGVWSLTGYASIHSGPSRTSFVAACLSTSSSFTSGTEGVNAAQSGVSNNGTTSFGAVNVPVQVVNISANTTYYMSLSCGTSSSSSSDIYSMTATRIA